MDRIISIINSSNQRGGRMLSVVDLIERETLTIEQAAWLTSRILNGSSFLVGANPGGAGKTTVMGALLGLLPPNKVVTVTHGNTWQTDQESDCFVAYEISKGFYYGYVWTDDVRILTRKALAGKRIVANLHADTILEAKEQIVDTCGASVQGFQAFGIFLPISTEGYFLSSKKVIKDIFYVPPIASLPSRKNDHSNSVRHSSTNGWEKVPNNEYKKIEFTPIKSFFNHCLKKHKRTIEEVRREYICFINRF